jgi:hypothetical protein
LAFAVTHRDIDQPVVLAFLGVRHRPSFAGLDVLNGCNPDFLNVDLTASRKFGDWEFGLVAFGSTDLNSPVDGYLKQSQSPSVD